MSVTRKVLELNLIQNIDAIVALFEKQYSDYLRETFVDSKEEQSFDDFFIEEKEKFYQSHDLPNRSKYGTIILWCQNVTDLTSSIKANNVDKLSVIKAAVLAEHRRRFGTYIESRLQVQSALLAKLNAQQRVFEKNAQDNLQSIKNKILEGLETYKTLAKPAENFVTTLDEVENWRLYNISEAYPDIRRYLKQSPNGIAMLPDNPQYLAKTFDSQQPINILKIRKTAALEKFAADINSYKKILANENLLFWVLRLLFSPTRWQRYSAIKHWESFIAKEGSIDLRYQSLRNWIDKQQENAKKYKKDSASSRYYLTCVKPFSEADAQLYFESIEAFKQEYQTCVDEWVMTVNGKTEKVNEQLLQANQHYLAIANHANSLRNSNSDLASKMEALTRNMPSQNISTQIMLTVSSIKAEVDLARLNIPKHEAYVLLQDIRHYSDWPISEAIKKEWQEKIAELKKSALANELFVAEGERLLVALRKIKESVSSQAPSELEQLRLVAEIIDLNMEQKKEYHALVKKIEMNIAEQKKKVLAEEEKKLVATLRGEIDDRSICSRLDSWADAFYKAKILNDSASKIIYNQIKADKTRIADFYPGSDINKTSLKAALKAKPGSLDELVGEVINAYLRAKDFNASAIKTALPIELLNDTQVHMFVLVYGSSEHYNLWKPYTPEKFKLQRSNSQFPSPSVKPAPTTPPFTPQANEEKSRYAPMVTPPALQVSKSLSNLFSTSPSPVSSTVKQSLTASLNSLPEQTAINSRGTSNPSTPLHLFQSQSTRNLHMRSHSEIPLDEKASISSPSTCVTPTSLSRNPLNHSMSVSRSATKKPGTVQPTKLRF